MVINKIPQRIKLPDDGTEAEVLFIAPKYIQYENGIGGETFMVICVTDKGIVVETELNEVIILKSKFYDGCKTRPPRRIVKKNRKGRKEKRDNIGSERTET